MRVYLSSRLWYRARLREYREALVEAGHVSTARWLDDLGGTPQEIAERDLEDIDAADAVIVVGHCGRNGGLFFEAGYALASGKRLIHVASEREPRQAFLWHDDITYVRTFHEALDPLTKKKEYAP